MSLAFRSPVTKPLLPKGAPKYVLPDPRAHDTFRVTQQFADPDFYYRDGRRHEAVDLGNFRCGDPVVAMRAGTARRVKDNARAHGAKTDGLGVVVDHGHGITTEYWHLDRQDVSDGQAVSSGQRIGLLGRTGLGDVCHLHVEAKRNGVKFDPEPLMFGGSITVEDDMRLPARLSALTFATLGPHNRMRRAPSMSADFVQTTAPIAVQVFGDVPGEAWTVGGVTGDRWFFIGHGLDTYFVAAALLPSVNLTSLGRTMVPVPVPDCSAQEATIAQLHNKISRAVTSAHGAAQAASATVEALR